MNKIPEKSWQEFLSENLIAVSEGDDPHAALRSFLTGMCEFYAASNLAIVAFSNGRCSVLTESHPGAAEILHDLDPAGIWRPAGPGPDTTADLTRTAGGNQALVLNSADSGDVPLALIMAGAPELDQRAVTQLQSARALIRLSLAVADNSGTIGSTCCVQAADQDAMDARTEANTRERTMLKSAVERLTAAQALSVELIDDLLSAPHASLDAAITETLARMGRFCGSDRTYLFREVSENTISNTHEWCAPGIAPMKENLQDKPLELAQPWYEAFRCESSIYIGDVAALPAEDEIRNVLEMQGIQSLLAVPLRYDGRIFGFVGYDSVRQKRSFLGGEISLIRSVANVMATMLAKRDVDIRLSESRVQQDLQRRRLQATLSVIPDILLELDDEMRIVHFHANPSVDRQIDLKSLVGLKVSEELTPEISETALRIKRRLKTSSVVDGYAFSHTVDGKTRHYSVSAARGDLESGAGAPRYIAILRDVTEHYNQRRKIEQLGQIVQRTTNIVIVTDTQARIEWVNPAFEARTGYRLTEVMGRTPGSFLQDSGTDQVVVGKIRSALRKTESITCELLNVSRSGEHYWVRMTIQPIFDELGFHQGFMSVQADVTETRKLLQEMKSALASEHAAQVQLKSAVHSMQEAMIMFDSYQRLVICNERYRSLYPQLADMLVPGTPRDELLREGLRLGLFGRSASDQNRWLQHQSRAFHLKHTKTNMRHLAGRWYREIQHPTPDGGRLSLLSDVTEWKDAEARAIADRVRALDASRDGIALVTARDEIAYLNTAGLNILRGEDVTELLGENWAPLLLGDQADSLLPLVRTSLERSGFWQGETHLRLDEEGIVTVDVSATLNHDKGVLCIFRDITEKRRNEAEREALREQLALLRRREELGHIAAGLTHDFNNLLSVISGSSQMIQETEALDMAQALAGSIEDASDQAASLLQRMLSLGKSQTVRELIDLRRPVRDAEALVRPGLRAPLTLSADLPEHPAVTYADSTAIVQMVMNLLINARDALTADPVKRSGGRISIAMSLVEGADVALDCDIGKIDPARQYARIIVQDNGPGMSTDVRGNIFSPYFSTKGNAGTGLGLPIVLKVVQDHAGALSLQSEPGNGVCFSVFLPIESAPEMQPQQGN